MTQTIEAKFNFKARKITDENGKEIGKTKKQPAVTVAIPVPTVEEIVSILQMEDVVVPPKKEGEEPTRQTPRIKQLVLDAIQEIPRAQAKNQFDEIIDGFGVDESKVVTPDMLDFDKLTLSYIANLEPGQRGVRPIPEEDFETFYEDYVPTMVAATGKPEVKLKNHIELFKKPTRAKQNKEVLTLLVDQLNIYMASSGNIEETAEVANRLKSRFEKWIKEEDRYDVTAL